MIGNNGSFGGNTLVETIGLGGAMSIARLTVTWPTSRTSQTFPDVAADQELVITEGTDRYRSLNPPRRGRAARSRLGPAARLPDDSGRIMRETATQPRQRPWWLVVSLSLLLGALLLLAGYCLVLPSEDAPRLRDRKPLLVSAASTLAPGVNILGGLSPSAAYVVRTSEGLVLVDSGLQADASRLKSQMAELGLDWHGVRAILLTHAHGDHVGGAQHLREMTGAKVYAGAGDAAVLRAGGPREAFFSIFHMPDDTPHPTTVDVELRGGESLAFGAVTFRALDLPGHTPGSICYLMEKAGLRASSPAMSSATSSIAAIRTARRARRWAPIRPTWRHATGETRMTT